MCWKNLVRILTGRNACFSPACSSTPRGGRDGTKCEQLKAATVCLEPKWQSGLASVCVTCKYKALHGLLIR